MGQFIDENSTRLLLTDGLMYNNRHVPFTQLMRCHTQYFDPFVRIHTFILRGDGPLPFSERHYIAIMAAARHHCTSLMNMEKQEFLMTGGNKEWLKGFKYIPKKLQDLNEINKLLAHQPWLLNKGHIEKLTKGSDSWSLSEVVHAIVILSHFHSLCSFVFGCGVNDTSDYDDHKLSSNGHKEPIDGSTPPSPPPETGEGCVEQLMQKMRTLSEQRMADETSREELVKGFERVETVTVDLHNGCPKADDDFVLYMDDPHFSYVDFARRRESTDVPTFRVQDYSWDVHGFSLVNRLYSDVGNLLDEKFKVTYNLTYNNMGRNTNVDTSTFRRAIWNYIQCMYGIRHDDYDYREVNELLDKNLKSYIKTVCCFPNRVPQNECDKVMKAFRRSEKIHVNLMISEARMQAALLYALRSVMKYMT